MKHKKSDIVARRKAFDAFLKAHPPKMPESFTHAEWKRVVSYSKIAFITGFNSGENHILEQCE